MNTLSQTTLHFNKKIKISNDGGSLSSDTGLFVFKEFDEKIGFSKTIEQHLDVDDERIAYDHSNPSMVSQKIYQTIAGYPEDMAAKILNEDPVFTQVLEKGSLASQSSLSRLYNRINENTFTSLEQANQELLDNIHQVRKSENLIIDLDSTHADTYGNQENSAYNAHYRTVGYHPLVAFDGVTGDFLKAELRSGNVYTSNGAVKFTKPIIEHYNQTFPSTTLMVRGDSGFAVPELYELCEKEDVYYIYPFLNIDLYRYLQKIPYC